MVGDGSAELAATVERSEELWAQETLKKRRLRHAVNSGPAEARKFLDDLEPS